MGVPSSKPLFYDAQGKPMSELSPEAEAGKEGKGEAGKEGAPGESAPGEGAPGEAGKEGEGAPGEAGKEGEGAAGEGKTVDQIKLEHLNIWKKYLQNIFDFGSSKYNITSKTLKKQIDIAIQEANVAPDNKKFVDKKIEVSKDKIRYFVNGVFPDSINKSTVGKIKKGIAFSFKALFFSIFALGGVGAAPIIRAFNGFATSGKYNALDLIEYIDKELLVNPELKKIVLETSTYSNDSEKNDIINILDELLDVKKPIKQKHLTEELAKGDGNDDLKKIYMSVINATVKTTQRHALLEVLNYLCFDSKEYKEKYKAKHVGSSDEAAAVGKGTGDAPPEAAAPEAAKPDDGAAPEAAPPETKGGSDYESDGGSQYSGDMSDSSYSGGSDNEELTTGGALFKTKEEKLAAEKYKLKKEEVKSQRAENIAKFFLDMTALYKFIDANQDKLLAIYESKIGRANINDKSPEFLPMIDLLIEAIDNYKAEEETTGAALEEFKKGSEAAPAEGEAEDKAAPAADEAAPAAGKETGDGGLNKESSTDPAETGDAKGDAAPADNAVPPGDKKPEGDADKDKKSADTTAGGAIMQGGSAKKKKRYTKKKKPQRISININVGNENVISDTSSSSSSSSSSDTSSDEEDEKIVRRKKKKHHKKNLP